MILETKEKTNLYYCEGRSDKVYQVQLDRVDGGYVVNFQFGRRGNALQSGTKTPKPLPYDDAAKIYNLLVAQKMARGYREDGGGGTPYTNPDETGRQSGLLPQLLNPIDEAETQKLIADLYWVMQEKKDGVRLLVRKAGNRVEGINRKGEFIAVAKSIEQAVRSLPADVALDGEAVGDVYWVFDLLALRGEDLRNLSTSSRLTALILFLEGSSANGALRPIVSAWSPFAKRELFDRLKRERAEGVVFKQIDAKYVAGRPNSGGDHLKHKFTASCTCRVLGQNEGRRSVSLAAYQHPGDGWVEVGNVTIPPNFSIPATDSLVDIRYLYAFPGGSLYQPVYLGERTDVDHADSVTSLKFKQVEDE